MYRHLVVLSFFALNVLVEASWFNYLFGQSDENSHEKEIYYNISSDRLKWNSHKYVFIGGLHSSGTSVMERLISSQTIASGLRVANRIIENRDSCLRAPVHSKYCIAPQDEGSFVTRAFQHYLNDEHDINNFQCNPSNPLFSWGHCSSIYHIGANDIKKWHSNMKQEKSLKNKSKLLNSKEKLYPRKNNKILANADTFRERIMSDWNLFWDTKSPYLVEKDIPNGVRSLLMQELFTREKTAFVFTMKVCYC